MFPRKLPRRLPAFLAVWRCQLETEAALVDLKGLVARLFVMYLLTMLRSGKGNKFHLVQSNWQCMG